MNRKQLILTVLACVILIGSVSAQEIRAEPDIADSLAESRWREKEQCKPEWLKKEFVSIDANHFYEYKVFNKNCKIEIHILNEHVKSFNLIFKRPNPVVFIDAFQNYILVKEVTATGHVLSYFVLVIVYDVDNCKFFLDFFAVNPRVDSTFTHIPEDFMITRILELDVNREFLAVVDENRCNLTVYKINIQERLNSLNEPRRLIKNGAEIIGGNSRVLFDAAHNEFLVDTNNCVQNGDLAIYNHVPVKTLTCLPLYPCDTKIFNLIGYNFQYVTQSQNKKALTTFLYRGYGDMTIFGAAHLKSKCPIRLISDEYNFFLAITDCDLYLSLVTLNADNTTFSYFADTLSNACVSRTERAAIFRDWKDIEVIVFIEGRFYFISCNKFFVYAMTPRAFTKVFEAECINNNNDRFAQLFIEIEKFRAMCK